MFKIQGNSRLESYDQRLAFWSNTPEVCRSVHYGNPSFGARESRVPRKLTSVKALLALREKCRLVLLL